MNISREKSDIGHKQPLNKFISVSQVDNMPSCCGSSAVGPDSDLQATGPFVRAQVYYNNLFKDSFNCLRLNITGGFFQAGGLISVLSTDGVDLNNLYPPSKGDSLNSSSNL